MTTLGKCTSLEEGISLPFPGDGPTIEKIVEKRAVSERSTTRNYEISLSQVDCDLEVDFVLSKSTLRSREDSSDSFAMVLQDPSTESSPLEDQPYSKESETVTGDGVDNNENLNLILVKQKRLELSNIIPSLAEEIKTEGESDGLEKTSCQIQENMISHLIEFIEQKALPAIFGLEHLQKQIQAVTVKSQQQIKSLCLENLLLENEIKNSYQANIEKEKKSWISQPFTSDKCSMMNIDPSTMRSGPDLNRGGRLDQHNMMATVKTWLEASEKEHDVAKEQLINVVRTLQKRVNQLELEMDLIKEHKYRALKKRKNVDNVTATTKPRYRQSVGQLERAFYKKASTRFIPLDRPRQI